MKRISLIALLVLISLCFSGCSAVMKILPVREYRGTPLTSLSYKTVDYMGGMSETYLLDFDGDLYGKKLKTELLYYIRPEEKFNSIDELTKQIHNDIETMKQMM